MEDQYSQSKERISSDASKQVPHFFQRSIWISHNPTKKKQPNMPCKRWGHTAAMYQRFMYVYGGHGKSDSNKNWENVYRLDCESLEWEKIISPSPLKPESRDSHSCARIGNKLYIFGGSVKEDEKNLNELWSFNLEDNTWKKIEQKGDIPTPREGHSVSVLQDKYMLLIGGLDTETEAIYGDMYTFNVANSSWRKVSSQTGAEISQRESQSCTLINDYLYIFGGQGHTINDKDIFYNDLFKVKLDFQPQKNQLAVHSTEIKPKLNVLPSPRASHSAVGYANRYLIIIGGEGQPDETIVHHPLVKQSKLDQDREEEEEDDRKPLYPKNDVWIYDIELNFWHELKASYQNGHFKPRFTHSTTLYKDQLFIFGGMMDTKQMLDDLMILHLIDDDDRVNESGQIVKQNQILTGSTLLTQDFNQQGDKICPTCHMVFSLSNWLSFTPQNRQYNPDCKFKNEEHFAIEEEKLQKETNDIKNSEQLMLDSKKESQPQNLSFSQSKDTSNSIQFIEPSMSAQFIQGLASQVYHPFQALALFVDNLQLITSQKQKQQLQLKINLCLIDLEADTKQQNNKIYHKGKIINTDINDDQLDRIQLFFQIYESGLQLNIRQIAQLISKFDIQNTQAFDKQILEQVDYDNYELGQYATNVKLGGFRLGETILCISGVIENQQEILNVSYMSCKKASISNNYQATTFMFSYNKYTSTYMSENGNDHFSSIMTNIGNYMTKEQLLTHPITGTYVYVLDLKRIKKKSSNIKKIVYDYQFSYNSLSQDIFIKKKGVKFFSRRLQLEKLVDYSFIQFVKHIYLKPPGNIKIYFNEQPIELKNYLNLLQEYKKNGFLDYYNYKAQFPDLDECGYVQLFNTQKYIDSQQNDNNGQAVIDVNEEYDSILNHQGILIYYKNRLISRAETDIFGPYMLQKIMRKYHDLTQHKSFFKFVGIIDLQSFIMPNMFKTGIDNQQFSYTLQSSVKSFIRQSKAIERVQIAQKLAKKSELDYKQKNQQQLEECIQQEKLKLKLEFEQEQKKKSDEINKLNKKLLYLTNKLKKNSVTNEITLDNEFYQMKSKIQQMLEDSHPIIMCEDQFNLQFQHEKPIQSTHSLDQQQILSVDNSSEQQSNMNSLKRKIIEQNLVTLDIENEDSKIQKKQKI